MIIMLRMRQTNKNQNMSILVKEPEHVKNKQNR